MNFWSKRYFSSQISQRTQTHESASNTDIQHMPALCCQFVNPSQGRRSQCNPSCHPAIHNIQACCFSNANVNALHKCKYGVCSSVTSRPVEMSTILLPSATFPPCHSSVPGAAACGSLFSTGSSPGVRGGVSDHSGAPAGNRRW